MDRQKGNRGERKKIAYISLAIIICCLIGMFGWFLGLTAIPKLVIPNNPMPTPNAFDTFNEAVAAMKDAKKIDYASQSDHAGRTLYDRPYSLKEKQELLTENKPVLSLFREGMKQEYMSPNIRSIYTLQPYLSKYRKLARLLLLESRVLEGKGDWIGAINSHIDAIEFGDKLKRGGPITHALVGFACQTIDQKGVLRLFDSLTSAQAKSVLTRLEMIDRQTYPLSKTLEEEKRCGQGQMLQIFRLIRSYKDVVELNDLSSGNPIDNNKKVLEYVLMDKRGVVDQYTRYMDSIIAISKQSHYVHPSMPVVPKDPINQLLDSDPSVLSSCIYSSISLTTTHKLLIVGLALKIYKDVHGKYPDRLSQLVPGILPKLPDDPFALSGTFKYRSGKDKYVLYSVGPDGKDDGGMPIDDKSRISKQFPNSTSRYVPREDSKGDIVLGTNVQ